MPDRYRLVGERDTCVHIGSTWTMPREILGCRLTTDEEGARVELVWI